MENLPIEKMEGPNGLIGWARLRGWGNRHAEVLVRRVFTGGPWNIYG